MTTLTTTTATVTAAATVTPAATVPTTATMTAMAAAVTTGATTAVATVTTVASNGHLLTAHEGDADQREKHREAKSQCSIHLESSKSYTGT